MEGKLCYTHTIYASYLGNVTQAISNNFVPLLLLTFQRQFGISLEKAAFLITVNFGVQLAVDMLSARFADRIGYRRCMVAAHAFAAAGIGGLAVFPFLLPDAYAGMMLSVFLYAVGGGLIEVLTSPIVEACPIRQKEAAMSLLHSFYCWGHVFVVLVSTVFFAAFGLENWRVLALLWAAVPFANIFYFSAVPIRALVEEGQRMSVRVLAGQKTFWILFLLMLCAGASEQGMSQWASAFAESALRVDKTVGDLAGPCLFAVLMGTSRVACARLSGKVSLTGLMAAGGTLCVGAYLLAALSGRPVLGLAGCALCGLSVGVMWPGTFSLGSRALPRGGTAMFALFALAGDAGCSLGPTVVGVVSGVFGENLKKGVLAAAAFPLLFLGGVLLYRKTAGKKC